MMDDRKFKKASLSDLDDHTLVLTVNERLSRWLLLQYNRQQKTSGKEIWVTPPISSIDAWTRETWQRSWSKKHILNPTQSQNLWENIIRKDIYSEQKDLLHIRGAADLAGQAFKLVKQYRLPESRTPYQWTEESKAFHGWMRNYESNLIKLQSIDSCCLLDELTSIAKDINHLIPRKIVFSGFDEINPQFENWLQFLEKENVDIRFMDSFYESSTNFLNEVDKNTDVNVQEFTDRSHEVIQCARWIRSIYSPEKTIGIIVPELDAYRSLIAQEFTSELSPQAMFPWNETELPFNISKGTPLKFEPAINLAIQLISGPNKFLPYKTFFSLITSPFIKGSDIEISERMRLDKFLRQNNVVKIFPQQIYDWDKNESVSQLVNSLKFLETFLNDDPLVIPSVWAKRISKLFQKMGWPFGDTGENNTLFPLLDKWNECLDIFASLDQILGKINRHKALGTFNRIIEIPYRKKSAEEPIQVVGLLESSGLEFDHLWVMGCDMKSIPAPPDPNPFIPMNLQKQYNLPHSTVEREYNFSQQILARIVSAAPKIIFSFAKWQDNSEQFLSPLLVGLNNLNSTPSIEKNHSPANQIQNTSGLESWEDPSEIPISNEELLSIKGGHSVLANMALCPFRAFSVHRLKTQQLDDPEIDIDAAKRGDLVHKAMELFWNEVKSHANLVKIFDEDKLVEQVGKNVEEAIHKNKKHFFHQPKFLEMETERIVSLILEWLQNEISRPPFAVVSTEKIVNLNINNLNLSLKIDRIDQTEAGDTVIVDYKTGKPTLQEWFQERLTQPQLPLYALDRTASAVVFAVIKNNNCDYKGIAKNQNVIPDIHHDIYKKYTESQEWNDQMDLWKKNLNDLSQNFIAGNISVDPIDTKTACKYCGLQSLCKIGEKNNFQDEDNFND